MLAGLIGALVGLVGANTASVRWPGPALATLALAVLLLLTSMQAWVRGQSFFVTLSEVQEHVPGPRGASAEQVAQIQSRALANRTDRYRVWMLASRWSFQIGLACFLIGLALVVLPPPGAAGAVWRWFAAVATVLTAAAIALVIARQEWRDTRWAKEVTAVGSGGSQSQP